MSLQYDMRVHPANESKVMWTAWVGDGAEHKKSLAEAQATQPNVILRVADSAVEVHHLMARQASAAHTASIEELQRELAKAMQDLDEEGQHLQAIMRHKRRIRNLQEIVRRMGQTKMNISRYEQQLDDAYRKAAPRNPYQHQEQYVDKPHQRNFYPVPAPPMQPY